MHLHFVKRCALAHTLSMMCNRIEIMQFYLLILKNRIVYVLTSKSIADYLLISSLYRYHSLLVCLSIQSRLKRGFNVI